jgi:hypothetical protein
MERLLEEKVVLMEEQLSEADKLAMDVSGAHLRDVSVDGGSSAAEEQLANMQVFNWTKEYRQ